MTITRVKGVLRRMTPSPRSTIRSRLGYAVGPMGLSWKQQPKTIFAEQRGNEPCLLRDQLLYLGASFFVS